MLLCGGITEYQKRPAKFSLSMVRFRGLFYWQLSLAVRTDW